MVNTKHLRAAVLAVVASQLLPGCASTPRDARIEADVRAVIDQLSVVDPPNQIDVQVNDRWVYLTGSANTELSIADVEAQVRKVRGVVGVTNSISVED